MAGSVLDLGAGTGKLTRALVERGLGVVAVEPSEGMESEPALAGRERFELPYETHCFRARLV